jgi:hypothetical protein
MSNKGVKRPKLLRSGPKKKKIKSRMSPWTLLLGGATLLGGIVAAVALLPRMVVSVSEPADPERPLSASFTVTNTNVVPLWDVIVGIAPGDVLLGDAHVVSSPSLSDDSSIFLPPAWAHHNLRMDEQFSIDPSTIFPTTTKEADLAIIIHYHPWFLPIDRSRAFRFKTRKQENGRYRWDSVPLH